MVAVAHHTDVHWFSALTGAAQGTIEQPHGARRISALLFDKESRWLLTTGDKHVRVFHNVPGHKVRLEELQAKLRTANTAAMKERLQQQIEELKTVLMALQQ